MIFRNSPTWGESRADGQANTGKERVGNDLTGPQPPFPEYFRACTKGI